MLSSPYFTRLAAATAAALLMAVTLMNARLLTAEPKARPMAPSAYASKECAIGEAVLSAGFAPIEQVLSVAPIGPPRIKGEADEAPLLRVIGRGDARIPVEAPAKGEIVAVSRSTRIVDGVPQISWSASIIPCADHILVYDGLASVDEKILRRLGAAARSGDDFTRETRIKIRAGDAIGAASEFDVGLFSSPKLTSAKKPRSPQLYLSPPAYAARCPIDHLKRSEKPLWRALFGDSEGGRLPAAESACATTKIPAAAAAQGIWLTDPNHRARTNKIASAAFTVDFADPDRLIFSFYGRLSSLDASMFDSPDAALRASAARSFLTATRGRERINAPFADIVPNAPYCYENLRAGIDGPRLDGVLILRLSSNAAGAPLLKVEAAPRVKNCENLREPWSFTGAETAFFRPEPAAKSP